MDEFLLRALLGGWLLAAMLGPLGSFVVWRRMSYFGDCISHSALLGVAISLVSGGVLPLSLAVLVVAVLVALLLTRITRDSRVHADTALGILAHSALALGLLLVALSRSVRVDINAYLFGDILGISTQDLWVLGGLAAAVLALFTRYWRPLMMVAIEPNIAQVEGVNVRRMELLLTLTLAVVIALTIKLTGVLLMTALLIIPAAAARYLARSPKQMALLASAVGALATSSGLFASVHLDAPTGPMMVVVASVLFVLCSFW